MVFVTRMGVIKRILLSDLQNIRRGGLRALGLNEGDVVVDVRLTDGNENILIATHEGKAITFAEKEVRAMGRTAVGLGLNEGDVVVDVRLTDGNENILIATHEGKAITFAEKEVRAMGRTAVGVRGIRLAEGDYVVSAARARKGAQVLSRARQLRLRKRKSVQWVVLRSACAAFVSQRVIMS